MQITKISIAHAGETYDEAALSKAMQMAQTKVKALGLAEFQKVDLKLVAGDTEVHFSAMPAEEAD